MSAARPETGATDFPDTGVTLEQVERAEAYFIEHSNEWAKANPVGMRIGIVSVCRALVPPTHLIIPRAYLDALEALLDAGSCIGVSDGRWAREGLWQDAENERDAAREEMGL